MPRTIRSRGVRFVVLGVLLSAAVLAAGASAATTIGQTGAPSSNVDGGFEIANLDAVVLAGGGTIVSLSTQSGDCSAHGTYNLQVLRPLGGGMYKVLGDTGDWTDPCDGQLHSYPVKIPVQVGDVLGVYTSTAWKGTLLATGGHTAAVHRSEPAVGETVNLSSSDPLVLDESATLVPLPQNKADCKNGGWENLRDGNGNLFKNLGDCVSYVATGGKNPANSG